MPRHLLIAALFASACTPPDAPQSSYYEERIEPIIEGGCARNPSGAGCHVADENGSALGNLDVTSYDSLMRRDDALHPYGPYSVGLALLKAGEPIEVQVETFDPTTRFVSITTDIRHNNGRTIDVGSSAYAQLRQWIDSGYQRTGVPEETLAISLGDCQGGIGQAPGWDPGFAARYPASYARFRSEVQPILVETCAGRICHGSRIADLFLTCGANEEDSSWNFWVAVQHVTDPAAISEILRRPLSKRRGGVFHEGGNIFASAEDADYQTIRAWAEDLVENYPDALAPPAGLDAGTLFFANRVQPALVREGCMFLNCHSPSMFHDLRLRGGGLGTFSRIATLRNYEMSRLLLALDSPDPNQSRLVAKNLYPAEQISGSPGIFHRGGSLFEDFGAAGGVPNGATPDDCATFDADAGDLNEVPAYCILVRWHQIEREAAIASGELADTLSAVFYVSRPTGVGDARDFDTYRPGADLLRASASMDATNATTLGAPTSVLAGCGLSAGSADIRGTAVSWNGRQVAFAARSSASAPLRLYWMRADGTGCELVPGVAPAMDSGDGILTHDFDPAFAPDGRLVFASSRGNSDASILGRAGPTRTPAALQPNANLFVFDQGTGEVRQLTYLLNQEVQPSFMTDGRLIFTTEKREPDFHQLAGRRQNLDGGDYHPLFAQRGTVGYASATEIVELLDRNLAVVAAPIDAADGAGAIVIVNRSIGPDQSDRDPADRAYISSQRIVAGNPAGGGGAFRSPSILPSGRLLVSCARGAGDLTSGNYDYDLCELDPASGALRDLGGAAGSADIEAVAVFSRARRPVFASRNDEVNGNTYVDRAQTNAEVEVLDFPMLATLLFQNTRTSRPIDPYVGGFDVIAEYPPPMGTTSFGGADVITDAFGQMWLSREERGHVDLNADGSTRFSIPGGLPIVLRVTDSVGQPLTFAEGAPFSGDMIQREQMQFYPGERAHQSFPRTLFNAMCGGCHGSISGRELDISADIDVLTSATRVASRGQSPTGL